MNIINYTRYNTEDLQAIVERIEQMPGYKGWRIAAGTALTVSEFDPADLYYKQKRWMASSPKVKKYVGKLSWSLPHKLSLLNPTKVYENALEAFSQAGADDGEQLAPQAMLLAVISTLRDRLTYESHTSAEVPTAGLKLRINKKSALKKPKGDAKEAQENRVMYAMNNVKMVRWHAGHSQKELHRLADKHFPVTETHLRGRTHLLEPLREAVKAAEEALENVIKAAYAFDSSL